MSRIPALTVLFLTAACSSGTVPELVAPRIVLLGYAEQPGSADSATLHQRFGGTVTLYPLIKSMTILTPLPSSEFTSLVPAPGRITDFDSLRCPTEMSIELTVTPSFGPADSDFVVAAGLYPIYLSKPHGFVDADITPARFSVINRLLGNSDIASAKIYFDCVSAEARLEGIAGG
ncbi:MAG TPA: hypothetical protein VGL65_02800 [Gemmatimonadales bacterium]